MSDPRLTPLAASLPATVPFVGPEAQERATGRMFRARLGANESLFGPSPRAIAAMEAASREVWKYGDPESHELKAALARHCGVTPQNIAIGEGIDGLLGLAVRLFAGPGEAVVTSDGAYPTFNYHVAGFGAALHKVPYRDDAEDPGALIARARETGARLVYLANPDNPMGSWHDAEVIEAAVEAMPEGTLLLLDEAYCEFAPESARPRIAADDPRVLRLRTFSKAYGMAGARIGYALGSGAVIAAFDRVRNHFGVNRIGQAGALAALGDAGWLAHLRGAVTAARDRISAIARENGLTPLPSATNFVAVDCGRDGAYARALVEALGRRGVFVRMPFAAPQNRCIRVSCGPEETLEILAGALPEALAEIRTG